MIPALLEIELQVLATLTGNTISTNTSTATRAGRASQLGTRAARVITALYHPSWLLRAGNLLSRWMTVSHPAGSAAVSPSAGSPTAAAHHSGSTHHHHSGASSSARLDLSLRDAHASAAQKKAAGQRVLQAAGSQTLGAVPAGYAFGAGNPFGGAVVSTTETRVGTELSKLIVSRKRKICPGQCLDIVVPRIEDIIVVE